MRAADAPGMDHPSWCLPTGGLSTWIDGIIQVRKVGRQAGRYIPNVDQDRCLGLTGNRWFADGSGLSKYSLSRGPAEKKSSINAQRRCNLTPLLHEPGQVIPTKHRTRPQCFQSGDCRGRHPRPSAMRRRRRPVSMRRPHLLPQAAGSGGGLSPRQRRLRRSRRSSTSARRRRAPAPRRPSCPTGWRSTARRPSTAS